MLQKQARKSLQIILCESFQSVVINNIPLLGYLCKLHTALETSRVHVLPGFCVRYTLRTSIGFYKEGSTLINYRTVGGSL